MKWAISFAAGCSAIVAVVVSGLWLAGAFGDLGLSLHGTIALLIGITLTVFLGTALMALVFYSDRSRQDETAHRGPTSGKPR